MTDFIARDNIYNHYTFNEITEETALSIRKKELCLFCIECNNRVGFRRKSTR